VEIVRHPGKCDHGWDEQLNAAQTEGGLCQSSYWARVIQRVDQAKPIYLSAKDGDRTVAQLLLFQKPPFDRQARRRVSKLKGLWRKQIDTLEFLDGPVLHGQGNAREILVGLLKWMERYALVHGIGVVRSGGFAITSQTAQLPEIRMTFKEFGYQSSLWASLVIDLRVDEESLWRGLDHAARKCIKKCEREGVSVRRITDFQDYVENFHKPYALSKEAYGSTPSPLHVQQVMFEEDMKGYNAFFVAESQGGQVLATLGMYVFNGVATEMASALTPAAQQSKIPAQDILHWEMIKYARANGCHTFNLAGVAPEPRDAREAGIRRFKEKWGGRYVEYYRFEKVMWPWRILRRSISFNNRITGVPSKAFRKFKTKSAIVR